MQKADDLNRRLAFRRMKFTSPRSSPQFGSAGNSTCTTGGEHRAQSHSVQCMLRVWPTAEVVEGTSDTDDDAGTQYMYNHADVPVAASAPTPALTPSTPRRLHDLPVSRRAAANAVRRSQPVASTSQSYPQSTICPVCLMVVCDSAIIPCGHCLCCTRLQTLTSTAIACARCPVCRTDISDTKRLHFWT